MLRKPTVVALLIGLAGACADNEQQALGPDPFVTNYGFCYSREPIAEPWIPHQRFGDTGTFSWSAAWHDFGFIAPLTMFDMNPTADRYVAQNNIYVEISEANAARQLPASAREWIYDRGYEESHERSLMEGFTTYRSPGNVQVLFVSGGGDVAGECTPPEDTWSPNPNCHFVLLAGEPGIRIDIEMPRRALARLQSIVESARALERSAQVPCPTGAAPTFRWEPNALHLPPYPGN